MNNKDKEKATLNMFINYMILEGVNKSACETLRELMLEDYETENKVEEEE